jgi:hypothetical protein
MSNDLGRLQVTGVRETIAILRQVDTELRKETVKAMRVAAQPLQAGARGLTPATPPLSGMARAGGSVQAYSRRAVTGITIRYGGKFSRSSQTWPLLRLQQKDPAGSVFDMAGRRNPSSSLAQNLTSRYGAPSRAMWRAADANLIAVQEGVRRAVDDAAATISRKIVEV